MKRWLLIVWLALAAGLVLGGCGQKGPLFLPDKPAAPDNRQ